MRVTMFAMTEAVIETEEVKTDNKEMVSETALIYELSFHLLPTLSEEEVTKEVDGMKKILENGGAKILECDEPSQMNLAYTMVKKQEGKNAKFDASFFGTIKFNSEPEILVDLKEELDLNKSVLRFLIIKTVTSFQPITQVTLRTVTEEDSKPIRKPEMVEKKSDKPISDAELDKTIEKLVSD